METVSELDQEHPDVFRHRDDHLADGLGLGALAVLDLVEFGDAVDEHRDLVAELGGEVGQRIPRVLDRVVEQCGRDRPRSEAELREDLRDRERVRDVRLAALALLALVLLLGDRVGPLDDREVTLGVIRAHRADQVVEVVDPGRAGEDAGNQPSQTRTLR